MKLPPRDCHYPRRFRRTLQRVSSISTSGFLDKFLHIRRCLSVKFHPLTRGRVNETEGSGMQGLAGKACFLQQRPQRRRGSSVDRVSY